MLRLDVERNLELSAIELLKAFSPLTALVAAVDVLAALDFSHKANYPAASVNAQGFAEFERGTGWYRGSLILNAHSHRDQDKNRSIVNKILGALRGWGQQTNLAAQLADTVSAKDIDSPLDVRDVTLDDVPFPNNFQRIQGESVGLTCLARASREVGPLA